MLFAFVYTNNAISERNEAIMKFKKISIGACILALVLIAGATTAFAATATNDNGSHISRSDAVLIDVDGNFQKVDVTAVSGNVIITAPVEAMDVNLRSISGRVRTEGVNIREGEGVPSVRVTGVTADLKLISIKD